MNESLMVVLGMTIAYAASFLGLLVAWWSYRKRGKMDDTDNGEGTREEKP